MGRVVGAPLVAAVGRAMFAPPQASMYLPEFKVLLFQVLVFDSAAACLIATGHRTVAVPIG